MKLRRIISTVAAILFASGAVLLTLGYVTVAFGAVSADVAFTLENGIPMSLQGDETPFTAAELQTGINNTYLALYTITAGIFGGLMLHAVIALALARLGAKPTAQRKAVSRVLLVLGLLFLAMVISPGVATFLVDNSSRLRFISGEIVVKPAILYAMLVFLPSLVVNGILALWYALSVIWSNQKLKTESELTI